MITSSTEYIKTINNVNYILSDRSYIGAVDEAFLLHPETQKKARILLEFLEYRCTNEPQISDCYKINYAFIPILSAKSIEIEIAKRETDQKLNKINSCISRISIYRYIVAIILLLIAIILLALVILNASKYSGLITASDICLCTIVPTIVIPLVTIISFVLANKFALERYIEAHKDNANKYKLIQESLDCRLSEISKTGNRITPYT